MIGWQWTLSSVSFDETHDQADVISVLTVVAQSIERVVPTVPPSIDIAIEGPLQRKQDFLNHEVGGTGVKPYQPANIWNEVSLNGGLRYRQDKGEKLYRRSMYTYWKRSSPMPNMLIFDSPSREKCVIQRQRTNTPLQALVTLNDPQFLEAGRALAQRLIKSGDDEASKRIDLGYRLATARPAKTREIEILTKLFEKNLARFRGNPAAAKEFLAVGESPRDESIDPAEHAAWMVIAQTIMNLDESLTRN